MFYIFSGLIPILIILIILWLNRPLSFRKTTKSLTTSLIPILVYILFVAFLEKQ